MAGVNEQYGAARQNYPSASSHQRGRNGVHRMPTDDYNDQPVNDHHQRQHRENEVPNNNNRNRLQSSMLASSDTPRRDSLDREVLKKMIDEWNATRLDIFRLSEPDANLVFQGNMRFYYREQDKSLTKCLKLKSTDTTAEVIAALTDKIPGDMRMLTTPRYSLLKCMRGAKIIGWTTLSTRYLYSLIGLKRTEKVVSCLKTSSLLRGCPRGDNTAAVRFVTGQLAEEINRMDRGSIAEFVRRVSKRGRKKLHTKEQINNNTVALELERRDDYDKERPRGGETIGATNGGKVDGTTPRESDGSQLYREIPKSSFHRSISNPEAVMRRRRTQKLERKLQQYRNQTGGSDTGGTLKIFGDALNQSVPYKTILLSVDETAEMVVSQMLQKYSMEEKDPRNYCLVRTVVPRKVATRMVEAGDVPRSQSMHQFGPGDNKLEGITLNDFECPLRIQFEFDEMAELEQQQAASNKQRRVRYADDAETEENALVFSIKPRSQALPPPEPSPGMPFLVDIETDERFLLTATNIVIGSSLHQPDPQNDAYYQRQPPQSTQYVMLDRDADILPQHCLLCNLGKMRYSIDLASQKAQVFVDQKRIVRKTEIYSDAVIQLGARRLLQLVLPSSPVVIPPPTVAEERVNEIVDSQYGSPQVIVIENAPVESSVYKNSFDRVDSGRRGAAAAPNVQPHGVNGSARTVNGEVLPATIEFPDNAVNNLLNFILHPSNAENPTQFALSPAFALYLAARYRASTMWHPKIEPMRRANLLAQFLFQTANMMNQTILEVESTTLRPHHTTVTGEPLTNEDDDKFVMSQTLAYWLANITELLHFLRNDRQMYSYCVDAQDVLESTAIMACHILARLQHELISGCLMPGLEYVQRQNASVASLQFFAGRWTAMVQYLDIIVNIMVGCCLNGSLIVQFVSLLFQAINAWCMNSILYRSEGGGNNSPLCSYEFGSMLFDRIHDEKGELKAWANRKDLHHAVDISLRKLAEVCRVINELPQLTQPPTGVGMTMQMIQQSARQLYAFAPSLNSVQLETLLHGYHAANLGTLPTLPSREFVNAVHKYAVSTDIAIQHAGGVIMLEESATVGDYPFTMPDAGYGSDDTGLGMPVGFLEFLRPLVTNRVIVVRPYLQASSWSVYFHPAQHQHHAPPAVVMLKQQQQQKPPPANVRQQQQAGAGPGRPALDRTAENGSFNGAGGERSMQHYTAAAITPNAGIPPQRQMQPPPTANEKPSPPPPLMSRPNPHAPQQQQPLPAVPPRPPTVPVQQVNNNNLVQHFMPNSSPVLPNADDVHQQRQATGGERNGYEMRVQQLDSFPAQHQQQQIRSPKIIDVVLQKKLNEGLGIKILSSFDEPAINGHTGNNGAAIKARISVTRIEPNSVAYENGQIEKDDILLAVNDVPLTGLSHQEAAGAIQAASNQANGRLRFRVSKR